MRWQKRRATLVLLIVIGTVLLAGCAIGERESTGTTSVKLTSTEDIVGIWESSGGFHRFDLDGTHGWGHSAAALKRLTKVGGGEFWFEDGRHYHTAILCPPSYGPGIYEIWLLDKDRVVFNVVEDDCQKRERWLVGVSSEPLVWTRVE